MDPIVEVARTIRPFLAELVGPQEAPELDERIAGVLNDEPGGDAASKLRFLLEGTEATSAFTAEVLGDAPDFRPPRFQVLTYRDPGSQPPPGNPQPVYAGKFACPRGDYVWFRPSVGTPIPACPTHHLALVRQP